jgi:hypothetical protein
MICVFEQAPDCETPYWAVQAVMSFVTALVVLVFQRAQG